MVNSMPTILREVPYTVCVRGEEYSLRVQELISGSESWPEKFRVQLHASLRHRAQTIYGPSDQEVAEKAAEYL
jgi:phenylacetate-coenzyme A ligase PaaK-like adenylate-forming protein